MTTTDIMITVIVFGCCVMFGILYCIVDMVGDLQKAQSEQRAKLQDLEHKLKYTICERYTR